MASEKENKIIAWKQKLIECELSVCEGFSSDNLVASHHNLYGRKVLSRENSNLSFLVGLALSGLRTNAILDRTAIEHSMPEIKNAVRHHLPITVTIERKRDSCGHTFSTSDLLPFRGAIQIISTTTQEAIDLALVSHRVSELTLTPTLHQISILDDGEIEELSKANLTDYLRNPDQQIDTPTPAQNMIFGDRRRLIPQWFNHDLPAQLGSEKDTHALSIEEVANEVYFSNHREDLIARAFDEFYSITGRKYDFVDSLNTKGDYVIITAGYDPSLIESAIRLSEIKSTSIAIVNIRVIEPFPKEIISKIIDGKKVVSVITPISHGTDWLMNKICSIELKRYPVILDGKYHTQLAPLDIERIVLNMQSRHPKQKFYTNVSFKSQGNKIPMHEVLLQSIERNYPHLEQFSLTKGAQNVTSDNEIPQQARQYRDSGPPFTQLSRFRNSTSVFYSSSHTEGLIADPFQAIPSIPAMSASLVPPLKEKGELPVIDHLNCSGCGECMVSCPYSAMPSSAIRIEELIKSGMKLATANGTRIISLLPHVHNLSKIASKIVSATENPTIEELLTKSFDSLIGQLKVESEKLSELTLDFHAIRDELVHFPMNLTNPFYFDRESQEPGAGELFLLTVDQNLCTACGLCSDLCPEDAIEMIPQSEEVTRRYNGEVGLWENIPDTMPETITRLLYDNSYNSFAALMLSRNFYYGMRGISSDDQREEAIQIVHLVTAVTESVVQPRIKNFTLEIQDLVDSLSESIHSQLSEAIPKENFDLISKAIEASNTSRVGFEDLVQSFTGNTQLKKIDSTQLKRKIELFNSLRGLKWSLETGPTGTGRSRFGMAMSYSDQFGWSNKFPGNPFSSPVVLIEENGLAETALGIIEGQLRFMIDNLKLIRKAKLEIKNKYVPREHDPIIAGLDWNELEDAEKKLIPPLLLFVDTTILESNRSALSDLCDSGKPLKLFVLDNLGQHQRQKTDISELIVSFTSTFIYQGSLASPESLFDAFVHGISESTASLFRIFASDQSLHSITHNQSRNLGTMAINSRAFPIVKYNPQKYKDFISQCISMEENPNPFEDFTSQSLTYLDNNEEKEITFDVTWADWAFTTRRWRSEFEECGESDDTYIPLANYLKGNKGLPLVFRVIDEKLVRYKPSAEVVNMARSIQHSYELLIEFSGNSTPFPDKLSKKIKEELQAKFDEDLTILKSDFESKLEEQKHVQAVALRKKLRDKLVELSTRKK